jgi:hypothetical protein
MPLYMDNQAAIVHITSEASSQRSKRIDIEYKFLNDLYYKARIMDIHVSTKSMLAYLMTKAFPTPDLRPLCRMIGPKADSQQNAFPVARNCTQAVLDQLRQ